MPAYSAIGLTNYFRVKDKEAFYEAIADYPAKVFVHPEDDQLISLAAECYDDQGWHKTTRSGKRFSIYSTVGKHLAEDEVAVFMEVGGARLTYLGGKAVAVNSKGKRTTVDLSDIYEKARVLTKDGEAPRPAFS